MARRTKVFRVDDSKSRDHGREYLLTEMAADEAEWWAFQVLQALLGSESEIDFNAPLAQMARQGLAALGKLPPDKAKPLLEQMMTCVKVKLPGTNESREMLVGDIEEVKTRVLIRKEVFELHISFLELGGA
jgi:hypothetical protein